MEVGGSRWSWVELGGGGWSWLEVGARFSNTHVKYFKESSKAEAYLEPKQVSMMELFCEYT